MSVGRFPNNTDHSNYPSETACKFAVTAWELVAGVSQVLWPVAPGCFIFCPPTLGRGSPPVLIENHLDQIGHASISIMGYEDQNTMSWMLNPYFSKRSTADGWG